MRKYNKSLDRGDLYGPGPKNVRTSGFGLGMDLGHKNLKFCGPGWAWVWHNESGLNLG